MRTLTNFVAYFAMTVAITLTACGGGGGGGGALGPLLSPAQQANVATASRASLASTQSQTANTSVLTAVSNLSDLISANPSLSSNSTVTAAAIAVQQALSFAAGAQTAAAAAAADLTIASNFTISQVVSAGRTICSAANSCTSAEIAALGFNAANTAKKAVEATLFAIKATNELKTIISTVAPTVNVSAATDAIATATSSASTAQATANTAIANYVDAAIQVGKPVITIAPSTGTTGSVVGTPTYSGSTQTIVTTYGDGTTSSVSNAAASNTVAWGSDHITKTTTYTYAGGGTNAVVDIVQPTASLPVLTAAVYTNNWTSIGVNVTKPSVSAVVNTYGDGTTTSESGSVASPFKQASLSAQSITDPNAVVRSTSTDYNLNWGTPDKNGPAYANAFAAGSVTFANNFQTMGHTISGQCGLGPLAGFCLNGVTIAAPHQDVLDAWNQGWTGKSQNILMIDGYSATNTGYVQGADAHGITTMMLANRYAIAATLYGVDFGVNGTLKNFDGTPVSNVGSQVSMGVINASFGANYWAIVGRTGNNVTSADVTSVFNQTQAAANQWAGLLDGSNSYGAKWVLTDAVITKSAGNDSITSDKESYVKTYADNTSIKSRLLVVGALNFAGSVNAKATIASYSNTAGTATPVASRFLVASGTDPFPNGALAVDGIPISTINSTGTSYAAPRVAGYVAVLRDKFPNLDAVKSSSIMLDTARYDTLTCNPNCDPNVYGKGEVSLSRALAPVGRLR